MGIIDIIALILILIHSVFRTVKPKEGNENRSGFRNFCGTFLFDTFIYIIASFVFGLALGAIAPFAAINAIFKR